MNYKSDGFSKLTVIRSSKSYKSPSQTNGAELSKKFDLDSAGMIISDLLRKRNPYDEHKAELFHPQIECDIGLNKAETSYLLKKISKMFDNISQTIEDLKDFREKVVVSRDDYIFWFED